jgi:hypothetical protein
LRVRRMMDAIVRSRLYLDQAGSNATALTDTDFSHLRWEESVAAALAGYAPTDASNNQLVAQPIRIYQGDMPQPARHEPKAKEWHQSTVSFEVEYLLLLHAAELA